MARSAASSSSPPSAAWRRYALIGVVLLVLVAVLVAVFWPRIRFQLWLGELHADSPAVNQAARAKLVASEDSDMNDWLYAVLVDPGRSFPVRKQIGEVLVERNRMGLLERALRVPDPAARTAALTVLHAQTRHHGPEWFQRSYIDGGAYPVVETLEAWLRREGDLSRRDAIELTSTLGIAELVPHIRPLVRIAAGRSLLAAEQQVMVAAAKALLRFGDCPSVASFVEPAREASDDIVRLRMVQALYDAVLGVQAKCPDAVPVETVKEAVLAALEDGRSNTRHGVLLILQKRPSWAEEAAERIGTVLDGETPETVYVRRAALSALAGIPGDAFAQRLPRYFHDEAQVIRSTAVEASRELAAREDVGQRFESGWIGILRDETQSDPAFHAAGEALRQAADGWIGLPEGLDPDTREGRTQLETFRREMFERGESLGVDRVAWADAWLAWWGGQLGLTEKAIEDARATRAAFWEAARRGDAAAAQAALDAFATPVPGLFTYEEGWLATHP